MEEEKRIKEYETEQDRIKQDREKRLAAVEARLKQNGNQEELYQIKEREFQIPEESKERKPDSTIMRVCNNAFDQIMNID